MKVFIIHASAGAGHRKAAEALEKAFGRYPGKDISVRLIDALDYTNLFFKKSYAAVYIFLVKYIPFVWGLFFHLLNFAPFAPLIGFFRHAFNSFHGRQLQELILKESPDIVICEHFFPAEMLSGLKAKGKFKGAVICGVTDFGVHQFWINKGTDYYFVASDATRDELVSKAIDRGKIIVTGIPIEEKFSKDLSKRQMRTQLGLSPEIFTVLVTSGGFGVGPIMEIVKCIDVMPFEAQIAVICGKNERLESMFSSQAFQKTVKVFGYVHNMDEFMTAADVIVSKSGGLTVSESLAKALPMLILKPIPGQETRNAEIIEQYNIGMRLGNVKDTGRCLERLLENDQALLKQMKENARKLARPDAADKMCQWIIKTFLAKS